MNLSKHITQNKTFLKHIFITLVIGGVVHFLNYLFNIYLARNLTVVDFGFYNAALGIATLIQIPTIAIQTAITKKVATKRDFNLDKFKKKSTLQLAGIGILFSLLFLIFGKQIANIANISISHIPALALVVFVSVVSPVAKGFLLGLEKILTFNLVLLGETLLKFLMGFIALRTSSELSITVFAFSLPMLLSTIIVLPLIKTKSDRELSKSLKLDYKQISLIFLTFFLLNIPFTLDLILVNPDIRASYGALSLIGKIVYYASVTIANVMISKLSNTKQEGRNKSLLISLAVSTAIGFVICLFYFLFKEEIVNFVFSGMYLDIIPYVVPYSLVMITYAISYMVITSELVNDSFFHLFILIPVSILQVVLYNMRNITLQDAFVNQVIIYGVLFLFVLIILILKILKRNGSKKNIKV